MNMIKCIKSDIEMKYYIINLLLILFVCTFVNCKEDKRNAEQNSVVNISDIQAVKVISAGGELGFSSSMVINKDSIYYSRTVAANESDNLTYSKKIKARDWKKLIEKIDVKMFGAAKEGHSVKPVDGIDTKIIITTTAGDISKMNAHNDPEWKNILDNMDQYSGKYKF